MRLETQLARCSRKVIASIKDIDFELLKGIEHQFENVRNGDRFWYENQQFTEDEFRTINTTFLVDLITRNTKLQKQYIPENVLFTPEDSLKVDFPEDVTPYGHNVRNLDENFLLAWQVHGSEISFLIQVKTLGWIGIGFESIHPSDMTGADIVLASFHDGKGEISDCYAGTTFILDVNCSRL